MCDVERDIDDYDEKQIINKLLDDLTYFCDNFYAEESDKQKIDTLYKNKPKPSEIEPFKPCVCKGKNVIEEAFYANLDEMRNEFLDEYNELSISDVGLIYQFVEFQKTKC